MNTTHASGYENTENRTQAWSLWQLKQAMLADLNSCHTENERQLVRAICGKEIREKAIEWSKCRKLTPGEIAISEEFGARLAH